MDSILIGYFWISGLFANLIYLCGVVAQRYSHLYVRPSGRPHGKLSIIRPISHLEGENIEKNVKLAKQFGDDTELLLITADEQAAEKLAAKLPNGVRAIGVSSEGSLSPKVAKMEVAWSLTEDSEFVVITDADIEVPDGLADRMLAHFTDEQVAGVSSPCLTTMTGPVTPLLIHNLCCDYLAICSVASYFKQLTFLQGAFMMVRRSVVEELGGMSALANTFGDDLRLGRLIEKAGYKLVLMPELLIHPCATNSSKQLIQRYHRWLLAQKAEVSGKFYVEILLNPTVIPFILFLISESIGILSFSVIVACRIITALICDNVFIRRVATYPFWLSFLRPVSDFVHFGIQVVALFSRSAVWQNRRYDVALNGCIRRRLD